MATMKENTKKVLVYLQEHAGEDLTSGDVAEALGLTKRSVDGSFTSFQKKGWGIREDAEAVTADGRHVAIKLLKITDAGLNINPDNPQE